MWKKVVTPTALVSLLWLAVGAATIYYLNWVYHSHARDLAENFTAIQAADSMQDVLWRLQATAMEVAERADSHTRIEVTELEEAFEGHLAEAEASSATPEAQLLARPFATNSRGIGNTSIAASTLRPPTGPPARLPWRWLALRTPSPIPARIC